MFTPYKNLLGKTCSKEEGSSQTSCCSKCPKGNTAASPTGDKRDCHVGLGKMAAKLFFSNNLDRNEAG